MNKNNKKKKMQSGKGLGAVCLLLVAAVMVFFVMPPVLYKMNSSPQSSPSQDAEKQGQTAQGSTAAEEKQAAVTFPLTVGNGAVEIESLFPFSGINPDAGNCRAEDVAALVVKNISDRYLSEATVNAVLDGAATLSFTVTELPPQASAIVFCTDNTSLLPTNVCTAVTAQVSLTDVSAPCVNVSVEGTAVTVTNTSSEEVNEIDVYYRDVFDGRYFGGLTYNYKIENLSAGAGKTFTAHNSLLGAIEVVRVAAD